MVYPDFKNHDRIKGDLIPWRKDNPINFYFLARKNSVYHKNLINFVNKRLDRLKNHDPNSKKKIIQSLAWITGVSIFVESSINVLTVGSIFRPIFDKIVDIFFNTL